MSARPGLTSPWLARPHTPTITVSAHSDVGRRRISNGDVFAIADLDERALLERFEVIERRPGDRGVLMVVADGLCLQRDRAVASHTLLSAVFRELDRRFDEIPGRASGELLAMLVESVGAANREIRSAQQQDPTLIGMGCTCVLAWVVDNHVLMCNVGDSRGYVIQAAGIRQISQDQVCFWEPDPGTISLYREPGVPYWPSASLSRHGRKVLVRYVDHLEAIARARARSATPRSRAATPP